MGKPKGGPGRSALLQAEDVVARAQKLIPVLRERRAEADELRKLPKATIHELRELGILGLVTPRELGGSDLGVDVLFEVGMALGRGCGSTAWCGGNWAIHGLLLAAFEPKAQEEVYKTDTFPVIGTGFSPLRAQTRLVDGGAVISGQWDFASGVHYSDWIVLMAISPEGPLAHLVPVGEVKILDTWHTGGLRGSGSTDVAAQDLFVPAHRLLNLSDPTKSIGRELYSSPWLRVPLPSVFSVGILGSMLGMAHGALEVFVERTQNKVGGLSGVKVGSRGDVHLRIGEAGANIDAATALVRAMYVEQKHKAVDGAEITMLDRVRWRRDAAVAGLMATTAVNKLFEVGGAHVLWLDDQLHQFQRDITAASHHHATAWSSVCMGYGRAALGLDHQVAFV